MVWQGTGGYLGNSISTFNWIVLQLTRSETVMDDSIQFLTKASTMSRPPMITTKARTYFIARARLHLLVAERVYHSRAIHRTISLYPEDHNCTHTCCQNHRASPQGTKARTRTWLRSFHRKWINNWERAFCSFFTPSNAVARSMSLVKVVIPTGTRAHLRFKCHPWTQAFTKLSSEDCFSSRKARVRNRDK